MESLTALLQKDSDFHQEYLRVRNDIHSLSKEPEDWTNELVYREWTDLDLEFYGDVFEEWCKAYYSFYEALSDEAEDSYDSEEEEEEEEASDDAFSLSE